VNTVLVSSELFPSELLQRQALKRHSSTILLFKEFALVTATDQKTRINRIAFALLCLFVFTVPLAQAAELPYAGAISKCAGLTALVAGVIAVAARRRVRRLGPVHMMMAGFILWSAITLCWSVAPDLTVQRILTYLQLFILVLLTWEMCVEEKDVLRLLSAFVLGTIIPALTTLQAFLPGQEILYKRAITEGYDPNNLAFLLAISLPVSYYLVLREKGSIAALYRLQMGFAICAILFSGSAATLICMAIGLSLVCWTIHVVPAQNRRSAFILIAMLVGVVLLLIPTSIWQHISEETRSGGITLSSLATTAVNTIQATPLGGYGAGSTTNNLGHKAGVPHTSFTMFAETGVMGVLTFMVLLGVLVLAAEGMSGPTKSFWLTVLGVWTVGVCGLNWDCTNSAWLLFGLLAAHSAASEKEAVTDMEKQQRRNYYIEAGAEVWS
jgi:hypothetical protein